MLSAPKPTTSKRGSPERVRPARVRASSAKAARSLAPGSLPGCAVDSYHVLQVGAGDQPVVGRLSVPCAQARRQNRLPERLATVVQPGLKDGQEVLQADAGH